MSCRVVSGPEKGERAVAGVGVPTPATMRAPGKRYVWFAWERFLILSTKTTVSESDPARGEFGEHSWFCRKVEPTMRGYGQKEMNLKCIGLPRLRFGLTGQSLGRQVTHVCGKK
jgi:hypothetical protein